MSVPPSAVEVRRSPRRRGVLLLELFLLCLPVLLFCVALVIVCLNGAGGRLPAVLGVLLAVLVLWGLWRAMARIVVTGSDVRYGRFRLRRVPWSRIAEVRSRRNGATELVLDDASVVRVRAAFLTVGAPPAQWLLGWARGSLDAPATVTEELRQDLEKYRRHEYPFWGE